jgi:drug/metabolite transporter (DMT)-like permease
VLYLAWGSLFLVLAEIGERMPTLTANGLRFGLAALLLALLLTLTRRPSGLGVPARERTAAVVVGAGMIAGMTAPVVLALRHLPSGTVALLAASVPMWVELIRLLEGERRSRRTLAGVALGLLGLCLLLAPGASGAQDASPAEAVLWSAVVVLGSGAWALFAWVPTRVATPSNPLVMATYTVAGASLGMTLAGVLAGERLSVADLTHFSAGTWLAFGYLVLIPTVLAYAAYAWLLSVASLSLVSTFAYVNPVVAVALAWLVLDQSPTRAVVLGGALVLAGVGFIVRGESLAPSVDAVPPAVLSVKEN